MMKCWDTFNLQIQYLKTFMHFCALLPNYIKEYIRKKNDRWSNLQIDMEEMNSINIVELSRLEGCITLSKKASCCLRDKNNQQNKFESYSWLIMFELASHLSIHSKDQMVVSYFETPSRPGKSILHIRG